ncbi:hypothetical protein C8R47DRAFT_1077957 [Mycena vitilis]|nr:hypothetical protein C8R47DRAFT_1083929 [Mycena vitilis]KAJ6469548.1 hypothetical protein C8R47DRAFT_1077957 [Mycena vitilis]
MSSRRTHPKRDPKFEILHSGTWWKDFHQNRARRRDRAARTQSNAAPLDVDAPAGSIYTFTGTHSLPIVGTVQNNGTILTERPPSQPCPTFVAPATPVTVRAVAGRGPHAPLAGAPGPSKKAQQIVARSKLRLGASVDPDEALLARLRGVRMRDDASEPPNVVEMCTFPSQKVFIHSLRRGVGTELLSSQAR